MAFSRSLSGDSTGEGGGSGQNPPQKKKVSLLEYRKRQREARRSGSKTECGSPLSTVAPLAMDMFSVAMETPPEPPPPPAPIVPAALAAPTAAAAALKTESSEESELLTQEEEEGQWTSSNSVEQVRERSYHRALLLSKDKDTDGETEGGGDDPALRDCPSPGPQKTPTQMTCPPDPSGHTQPPSRPVKEEEIDSRPQTPNQTIQLQNKPAASKPAPLTPTKLHTSSLPGSPGHYPSPSVLHSPKPQAQGSPFRGQRALFSTQSQPQPQPQAQSVPASFSQYNPQGAPPPPPPPPPAHQASTVFYSGQAASAAGPFVGFKPAVGSPFPPGSQPILQTLPHALHYQSSAAPPPPPPPPPHHQPSPALLHVNLQPPSIQQHQLLLSAAPPPPPPPQGQVLQQQPVSGSALLSLSQGPPPPPPPPPPAPSTGSHLQTAPIHFQNLGGFQPSLLHQGASANSSVAPSSYSLPHQQTGLPPPPPPPPQQTQPGQGQPSATQMPSGTRGAPASSGPPFHSSGYLGSGWH